VGERQPTNSELHLQQLEADEARELTEERGILELFEDDEDIPIAREDPE
jgi:hypothetical protein